MWSLGVPIISDHESGTVITKSFRRIPGFIKGNRLSFPFRVRLIVPLTHPSSDLVKLPTGTSREPSNLNSYQCRANRLEGTHLARVGTLSHRVVLPEISNKSSALLYVITQVSVESTNC